MWAIVIVCICHTRTSQWSSCPWHQGNVICAADIIFLITFLMQLLAIIFLLLGVTVTCEIYDTSQENLIQTKYACRIYMWTNVQKAAKSHIYMATGILSMIKFMH